MFRFISQASILWITILLLTPELSISQTQNVSYTVLKGVIYCETGIPEIPRWFADNRLAFSMDDLGITQVDYYSTLKGQGLPTLFLRQLWDGFRYFLECDNKTYKPEYRNSSIWPFGIESQWTFQGAIIRHRVMAINGSIVIQVTVPENIPDNTRFKMEFFEAFALTKGSRDDLRFSDGGVLRKMDDWKFSESSNTLEGGFLFTTPKENEKTAHKNCVIGADFPIEHSVREINVKHMLKSPLLEAGKTYSFCISIGEEDALTVDKNHVLTKSLGELIHRQFERYEKVAANSPSLQSPYPELNNFISLAPMYHEALKIIDMPGAMRAKTSNYWVWGWDGMTSNYATAYWGDVEHMKSMLEFYETTADSVKGIGHAFNYDMSVASISALPAQGMYVSLLQLYYANTKDIRTLRKHYPFAKTIFNRIAKSEVAATGFCSGSSLFPDFPEAMKETGDDLSGFNNTVFYCAARSMEWMAAMTGDKEQQRNAGDIIRRFEAHFTSLFFNPGKQFIVSSIDSKTLQQRDSYSASAIRWENNYCADITDSINGDCLEFFKKNAVTPMGIREIPLWNSSYDMDANQLHCWWPVTGEYFMRVVNAYDQKQLVEQWIKWVSYWTKHLTVPEGISYYIETDEPEFDRWTSQKGTWQAYSMRGWYQAALHGVVGVGTDVGGITFYPYSGEELTLAGLNYLGKKFDIEMKGTGRFIESIQIDGTVIRGSNKLPADLYSTKARVKVIVTRTGTNPNPIFISEGTGIELHNYTKRNNMIKAKLVGAGVCRLKLISKHKPRVKLSGKMTPISYDPERGIATVEINLQPDHSVPIQIY